MPITRQITRVVMQTDGITGDFKADGGLAIYLKTDSGALVATASESPAGNYTFSWTATNAYGYFWIGAVRMDQWGHQWLGEVVGSQNLDSAFEIDQPLTVSASAKIYGAVTGPSGWNGIIKATAGVLSADGGLADDSDVVFASPTAGQVLKYNGTKWINDSLTHNALNGLQGGTSNEYYHLTASEYAGTGTGTFVRQINPALSGSVVLSGSLSASGGVTCDTVVAAHSIRLGSYILDEVGNLALDPDYGGGGAGPVRIMGRGLIESADNTYDWGLTGATALRPRSLYVGSNIFASGSGSFAGTLSSSGGFTGASLSASGLMQALSMSSAGNVYGTVFSASSLVATGTISSAGMIQGLSMSSGSIWGAAAQFTSISSTGAFTGTSISGSGNFNALSGSFAGPITGLAGLSASAITLVSQLGVPFQEYGYANGGISSSVAISMSGTVSGGVHQINYYAEVTSTTGTNVVTIWFAWTGPRGAQSFTVPLSCSSQGVRVNGTFPIVTDGVHYATWGLSCSAGSGGTIQFYANAHRLA